MCCNVSLMYHAYVLDTPVKPDQGFRLIFSFLFLQKKETRKLLHTFVQTRWSSYPHSTQIMCKWMHHTHRYTRKSREFRHFLLTKHVLRETTKHKDKTIAHLKHVIFSSSTSLKPWVEGKLFVQGCLSLHHVYEKHHEEQRWYLLTTSSLQLVVDHWHWGRK